MQNVGNQKCVYTYVVSWVISSLISSNTCHGTYCRSSMYTLIARIKSCENGPKYACTTKVNSGELAFCRTLYRTFELKSDSTTLLSHNAIAAGHVIDAVAKQFARNLLQAVEERQTMLYTWDMALPTSDGCWIEHSSHQMHLQNRLQKHFLSISYLLITFDARSYKIATSWYWNESLHSPLLTCSTTGLTFWWAQRCRDGNHSVLYINGFRKQQFFNDFWKLAK